MVISNIKAGASFLAFCAVTSANYLPARQAATAAPSFDASSIAQALGTALPLSLLQGAINNPQSVASMIAAEFSEGRTPDWFLALPSTLQSQLLRTGVALPASTQPPFAIPPIIETTLDPNVLSSILYTGEPSSSTTTSSTLVAPTTSHSTTSSTPTTTSSSTTSSGTKASSSSTTSSDGTTNSARIPTTSGSESQVPAPSSTGGAVPQIIANLALPGVLGLAGLFAI